MTLKRFNVTNTKPAPKAKPEQPATIGFDVKTGLFRINKAACELMGLKEKLQLEFAQDEESLGSWYVHVVKSDGFELRQKANVTAGLLFSNAKVAQEIVASVAFTERSGKVAVIKEPVKIEKEIYWALDLSQLKSVDA